MNAWIEANGGSDATGGKRSSTRCSGCTNGDYQVEPWSPVDSLAWLKAMAWDLRGNMEAEIDPGAAAGAAGSPGTGATSSTRLPVPTQPAHRRGWRRSCDGVVRTGGSAAVPD